LDGREHVTADAAAMLAAALRTPITGPQGLELAGLELRTERRGSTVVIGLGGELDAHNSRTLELLGMELLAGDGVTSLVIDGARVVHVGASGLAAILELRRLADERAVRLRVVHPSRVLGRLMRLAGLEQLVDPVLA
jgi:anti-anti-sigma factor